MRNKNMGLKWPPEKGCKYSLGFERGDNYIELKIEGGVEKKKRPEKNSRGI